MVTKKHLIALPDEQVLDKEGLPSPNDVEAWEQRQQQALEWMAKQTVAVTIAHVQQAMCWNQWTATVVINKLAKAGKIETAGKLKVGLSKGRGAVLWQPADGSRQATVELKELMNVWNSARPESQWSSFVRSDCAT